MRVLLVSHVAPPHIGGVENLVQFEAEAFAAAGHRVEWLTSDADGDGDELTARDGVTVQRVPAWHLLERRFRIAFPLFSPSLVWRLWRAVGRADLVHVHGLVFLGSPLAALFARLRGKRCLCTDHGGMLHYRSRLANAALWLSMQTLGRVTARCSTRLIAYNREVEALLTRLGGRADKVLFLSNPVDLALFHPPTDAERRAAREALGWDDRPRALCVSRLLPHKGIDVLLEARQLGGGAFEAVFCGPGEDRMREHIRDRGGECLPPRPRDQVRQLYHAADVFVLPSHNEGFPVAIQEALSCGLPVVTSDHDAYAPYRGTPGLHLCEPSAAKVREQVLQVLGARARREAQPHADDAPSRWIEQLCAEPRTAEGGA